MSKARYTLNHLIFELRGPHRSITTTRSEDLFEALIAHEKAVKDHLAVEGLTVVIDKSAGTAVLRRKSESFADTWAHAGGYMPMQFGATTETLDFWASACLVKMLRKHLDHQMSPDVDKPFVISQGLLMDEVIIYFRPEEREDTAKLNKRIGMAMGKLKGQGLVDSEPEVNGEAQWTLTDYGRLAFDAAELDRFRKLMTRVQARLTDAETIDAEQGEEDTPDLGLTDAIDLTGFTIIDQNAEQDVAQDADQNAEQDAEHDDDQDIDPSDVKASIYKQFNMDF